MQAQGDKKPRVVRRLFVDEANGVSDEPSNVIYLSNELTSALEAAKERWNFDFEREVPLEGPWQWERVQTPEEVEAALHEVHKPDENSS